MAENYGSGTSVHDINHIAIMEGNHGPAAKQSSSEAARRKAEAQLYAIATADNVFSTLRTLYLWEGPGYDDLHKEAAKAAFNYLKAAGYRDSVWENLGPEKINNRTSESVESLLRNRARKALKLLVTDNPNEPYHLGSEEMAAALDFETNARKSEVCKTASEMMGLGTGEYEKTPIELEILHGSEVLEKLILRDSKAIMETDARNILKWRPIFTP